jgi:hypothetical protein
MVGEDPRSVRESVGEMVGREEPGIGEDAEIRILLEHVKSGEVPVDVAQGVLSNLIDKRLDRLEAKLARRAPGVAPPSTRVGRHVGGEAG